MIRLAAVLFAGLALAGCQTAGGGMAQAPAGTKIGHKYWIKSSLGADLCPQPTQGFRPAGCKQIASGGFTVLESVNSGYPRFWPFYKVQMETGDEGYFTALTVDLAQSEEAHASELAARAESQNKAAVEKKECDRRGGIRIGMNREQVYASCWGKPVRTNRTTTASGDHDQLVYGSSYVYLRNGVVTSIQTSTR